MTTSSGIPSEPFVRLLSRRSHGRRGHTVTPGDHELAGQRVVRAGGDGEADEDREPDGDREQQRAEEQQTGEHRNPLMSQ